MKTWPKLSCGCLALLSMVSTSPLWADEAARDIAVQVNSANRLLRDGNVDEAITAYRQAQESGLHASELAYNLAVAQYRQGDVAAAAQQFRSAAAADNDAIAAKARFNLGNCDYVAGLKLAQRDPPAAVDRLLSAIGHYRAALDIDASDVDARANIELACQLIEQLREQQNQEQQSQQEPSQQDQQNNQQQDQQQQDQQQNSEQQSPEQQDQQQQPGEDQQQNQDGSDQQEDQQQQAGQSQTGESGQDPNDQTPTETPKDQDGQTGNEQSSQQGSDNEQLRQDTEKPAEQEHNDDSNRSRPSRSNQNDKDSAGNEQDFAPPPETDGDSDQEGTAAPKGSLSSATQSANDEARNRDERVAAEHAMDGAMTAEEAQKMLQSIRDREMLRRLRRQAAERNRHIPVDRDW